METRIVVTSARGEVMRVPSPDAVGAVECAVVATQNDTSALNTEKAAKVAQVTMADATEIDSAVALVNELKAKLNSMNL